MKIYEIISRLNDSAKLLNEVDAGFGMDEIHHISGFLVATAKRLEREGIEPHENKIPKSNHE